MKQKYFKPTITVHTIQLSLMATVDNGEELGSKHFEFFDEE